MRVAPYKQKTARKLKSSSTVTVSTVAKKLKNDSKIKIPVVVTVAQKTDSIALSRQSRLAARQLLKDEQLPKKTVLKVKMKRGASNDNEDDIQLQEQQVSYKFPVYK